MSIFIILVYVFIMIMFINMIIKSKKEKKQRKQMIDELKQGDIVRTIGGFVVEIVEIKEDDFIVKFENTNVKTRIAKNAIVSLL